MAQCLRINFTSEVSRTFLRNTVQKSAKLLDLEGMAQMDNNVILIVVCGSKDHIDQFVDILHKEIIKQSAENIEIEPFIKEKDYRGVFRVIE